MTRRYQSESTVAAGAADLYRALTDLRHWPAWDPGLESVEPEDDAAIAAGSRFVLKPRGGPRVRMRVEVAEASRRFVDVAQLPLARMRTAHDLEAVPGGGTRVRVSIEVSGPLAWLWDRVIARGQAAAATAQTEALAAYAAQVPS
jgi:hypothetical protein